MRMRTLAFALAVLRVSPAPCINTAAGIAAGAASAAPSAFSLPNAAVLVAAPGAPAPTFFLSTAHAIWAAQDDGSSVLFAGASTPGFAGDGASASNARFNTPLGLAAALAADALLVADSGNSRVRMIMLSNATIKTLVGSGVSKVSTGDGGPPAAALLVKPVAVAVSPATGDVFIADQGAACVRRARYGGMALTGARPGVIDTAVGTCDTTTAAFAAALSTVPTTRPLGLLGAVALAFDLDGVLYVVDAGTVWRVIIGAPTMTALYDFSRGFTYSATLKGGLLNQISSITVREDPSGTAVPPGRLVLIASNTVGIFYWNSLVLAITPAGDASVYSGLPNTRSVTGDGGPALMATNLDIYFLTTDAAMLNVFFVAHSGSSVRLVTPAGTISTVLRGTVAVVGAGTGLMANTVPLNGPRGVTVAPSGDIYFSEIVSALVRVIFTNGTLGTVAGNGIVGYSGDGGPALLASLNYPYELQVYKNGDILIGLSTGCVRVVSRATGIIRTVAGQCGRSAAATGDGGPAIAATFTNCGRVVLDQNENIYIADSNARRVRVVNAATGIVSTFAGTGAALPVYIYDYSWEGGPALSVNLHQASGLLFSRTFDKLYIVDSLVRWSVGGDASHAALSSTCAFARAKTDAPHPTSPTPPPPLLAVQCNFRRQHGDKCLYARARRPLGHAVPCWIWQPAPPASRAVHDGREPVQHQRRGAVDVVGHEHTKRSEPAAEHALHDGLGC